MRTSTTLAIAILTTFIIAGCGEKNTSAPSDPPLSAARRR